MASSVRLRILRLCLDQALTNKEIAHLLGRDPASVLYHVRRLVRTGFLAPEPERRGTHGAREVPYQATGKSWVLEIVETHDVTAEHAAMLDAFLEEVREAGLDRMRSWRLGLRLTDPDFAELQQRMQALLEEFRRRRAGGAAWSIFVALHPDTRPVDPPAGEVTEQPSPGAANGGGSPAAAGGRVGEEGGRTARSPVGAGAAGHPAGEPGRNSRAEPGGP